jgi:hypothetical protein
MSLFFLLRDKASFFFFFFFYKKIKLSVSCNRLFHLFKLQSPGSGVGGSRFLDFTLKERLLSLSQLQL